MKTCRVTSRCAWKRGSRLAVVLLLGLVLLGCQIVPRDLRQERLHLPRYENYFAADEAVVHILLAPNEWLGKGSAFQKRADLFVTVDDRAVNGFGWIAMAPRPHAWVWQVQALARLPEERPVYVGPVSQSFEPLPGHVHAFIVIFDGQDARAGFVSLGGLGGGARGLSVEQARGIAGGSLAEEIADWTAGVAARWNRNAERRKR
jgi:hypothetical protein